MKQNKALNPTTQLGIEHWKAPGCSVHNTHRQASRSWKPHAR